MQVAVQGSSSRVKSKWKLLRTDFKTALEELVEMEEGIEAAPIRKVNNASSLSHCDAVAKMALEMSKSPLSSADQASEAELKLVQFCTRFQKENVERKTLKDESIKRFPCQEQPDGASDIKVLMTVPSEATDKWQEAAS
ncbi:hypothetical protein Q9233_002275 [Columba guinea]|nr:hypothetical protein Q9233_002275 [Columba guinea]